MNVGDALTHYLSERATKLDSYAHQELHRFGRRIGLHRTVEGLAPPDVATYAEEVVSAGGDIHGRLSPVKDFLAYLKKHGHSAHSLSAHVKIPRASSRASASYFARQAFEEFEMTASGYQAIQDELAELKGQRGEVVEAIRIAAADKDFRENAPLDAAREDQGKAEARIRNLEETLRHAIVVDRSAQDGKMGAKVGATVVLHDLDSNKDVTYTLVDSTEADPSSGKISVFSPVGGAIVGKREGGEVDVQAPKGTRRYRISSVKF